MATYLAVANRRCLGALDALVVAAHVTRPCFSDEKLTLDELSEVCVDQAGKVAVSRAELDVLAGFRRIEVELFQLLVESKVLLAKAAFIELL